MSASFVEIDQRGRDIGGIIEFTLSMMAPFNGSQTRPKIFFI